MNFQARVSAIGLAAILAITLASGGAAARALVTQTTGPSSAKFPVGSILKEPLEIELVSGDRVTVLDAVGSRVLVGPMQLKKGEVRRPPEVRMAALRGLFENGARARAGGIRSMSGAGASSVAVRATPASGGNLWTITSSTQGSWCVDDPDAIEISREQTSAKGKLILTAPSGVDHEAIWRKGESLIYWPADAKIAEGSTYQFRYEKDESQFVTFHLIKAEDRDIVTLGKELFRFDCHAQLDMLFGDRSWEY